MTGSVRARHVRPRGSLRWPMLWGFGLLLIVLGWIQPGWAASLPRIELAAHLDPVKRTLQVAGKISMPSAATVNLRLCARSQVASLTIDGRAVLPDREALGRRQLLRWRLNAPSSKPTEIRFSYVLPLQPLDPSLDHRQVLGLDEPLSGADGTFVPASSAWYPQPEGSDITYRVELNVPAGYRALVSGKLVEESVTPGGVQAVFDSDGPLPGIDLLAGPYSVGERMLRLDAGRSVLVRTYFHAELREHAEAYLQSAAGYIERYDKQIGPYARPAYSIVSAPLPTGFGMPGIAYLGRQIIRLPFIRTTSLGHEVLHDWWGNGVYVDYAKGNWAEGLTTFMADYAFREEAGIEAARAMRLGWLRDYVAVPPAHDRALSSFVSRRHGADQAVGYNKTAFVFLMLRDRLGERVFNDALRALWKNHRGRVAGWNELQQAFERASGQSLDAFFRQWVDRAGAPAVEVVSARRMKGATDERITVVLRQRAPAYGLDVPVRVHLADGGVFDASVPLTGLQGQAVIAVPARATSIAVDPEARLFRRLEREEVAPTLRLVILDPRTLVVLGQQADLRKAAMELARATLEHGVRLAEASAETGAPLFLVGSHGEIPGLLQGLGLAPVPPSLKKNGSAFAYADRTESGRHFVVVSAPDAASLAALTRSLPHLGGQSFAVFAGGRSVDRGIWPSTPRRIAVEGP